MKWYKISFLLLIALLVYFFQEGASFHLIQVEKTPDERPAYNPQLSVTTGKAAISRKVQFHCDCLSGSTCCLIPETGGYYCCPYTHGECCDDLIFCCPEGTRCTALGRCEETDQFVRKQDNTTDVLEF